MVDTFTSEQIRAARALLRWEQTTLAKLSGVSLATIKRIEAKPGHAVANQPTLDAVELALMAAGILFRDGGVVFREVRVGDPVCYRPDAAHDPRSARQVGAVSHVEPDESWNPMIRVRFRDHETPLTPRDKFFFIIGRVPQGGADQF